MNAVVAVIAVSVLGVDVGWQPLPDGGLEYIIQIEPQLLDTLRDGKDLGAALPAGLDVRRYRITVGNAQLPHEAPQPNAAKQAEQAAPATDEILQDRFDTPDQRAADIREPTTAEGSLERSATDPSPSESEPAASTPPERDGPLNFSLGGHSREPMPATVGDRPSESPSDEIPSLPPEPDRSNSRATSVQPPRTFDDGFGGQPIKSRVIQDPQVNPAGLTAEKRSNYKFPGAGQPEITAPPKPWMTLILTALGLCVSVSGNAYLGWIAYGARTRYRALLDDMRHAPATA